jgi:hypothetical protein
MRHAGTMTERPLSDYSNANDDAAAREDSIVTVDDEDRKSDHTPAEEHGLQRLRHLTWVREPPPPPKKRHISMNV